jgi:hypothetical protein
VVTITDQALLEALVFSWCLRRMRRQTMLKYLGVGLAIVVLLGISTLAQKSPSSFWAEEFLGAEVGAVIGGAIGLGTVHTSCLRFEKGCDPLYRLVILQQKIPIEGDPLSVIKLTSPGFHAVNMGRGLGALAGVVLIGVVHGVEGNIWAAFLATQAWVAASQEIFILKLPLIPAFVATAAYNWGATMKADKTPAELGWSLSVIELKF